MIYLKQLYLNINPLNYNEQGLIELSNVIKDLKRLNNLTLILPGDNSTVIIAK